MIALGKTGGKGTYFYETNHILGIKIVGFGFKSHPIYAQAKTEIGVLMVVRNLLMQFLQKCNYQFFNDINGVLCLFEEN